MRNIFTKIAAPVIGLFMLGVGASKADAITCHPDDEECKNNNPQAQIDNRNNNANLNANRNDNSNMNSADARAAALALAAANARNETTVGVQTDVDNKNTNVVGVQTGVDVNTHGGTVGDTTSQSQIGDTTSQIGDTTSQSQSGVEVGETTTTSTANTGASTSHTGDNSVTIGGDNIDARSDAVVNVPSMGNLHVPSECMSGSSFTVGGSISFVASLSGGYTSIDPAGVAMSNGYTMLSYFEATDNETRETATEGMSDPEMAKLECLAYSWEEQRVEREARVEDREDRQDHELTKRILEHNLDRKSNAPGARTGASVFEHAAAHATVAEEVPNYKKAMTETAGAYIEAKKEHPKGDLTPVDVLLKMYAPEAALKPDDQSLTQ